MNSQEIMIDRIDLALKCEVGDARGLIERLRITFSRMDIKQFSGESYAVFNRLISGFIDTAVSGSVSKTDYSEFVKFVKHLDIEIKKSTPIFRANLYDLGKDVTDLFAWAGTLK